MAYHPSVDAIPEEWRLVQIAIRVALLPAMSSSTHEVLKPHANTNPQREHSEPEHGLLSTQLIGAR